jgi:hypothetical protein
MTRAAIAGSGKMGRRFASGQQIVVTTLATANDIAVIHLISRIPYACGMAGFAKICRWNMV